MLYMQDILDSTHNFSQIGFGKNEIGKASAESEQNRALHEMTVSHFDFSRPYKPLQTTDLLYCVINSYGAWLLPSYKIKQVSSLMSQETQPGVYASTSGLLFPHFHRSGIHNSIPQTGHWLLLLFFSFPGNKGILQSDENDWVAISGDASLLPRVN